MTMEFDTGGILRQIDELFDDAKQYAEEVDKEQLAVACVARAEQWRMVHAVCERQDATNERLDTLIRLLSGAVHADVAAKALAEIRSQPTRPSGGPPRKTTIMEPTVVKATEARRECLVCDGAGTRLLRTRLLLTRPVVCANCDGTGYVWDRG